MPTVKEPDFFARNWGRGIGWYQEHFPIRPAHILSGEASVSYTAPDLSAIAAARIAAALPGVQLICLMRHPLDRARSHYRHMVQRGVEKRSFDAAVSDLTSDYVRYSRYGSCLGEYVGRFGEQLLLVRFEDLVDPPHTAWHTTLAFLRLADMSSPSLPFNTSARKDRFTRPMRLLWRSRWAVRASQAIPAQLRKLVRPLFISDSVEYRRMMLESSALPFPESAASFIWGDIEQFEAAANHGRQLWSRV